MPQGSLKIGDWLLEPGLNRLSRDDRVETLEPLAAEVLAYLAEHAGEVVSADRLTETLWPRRFVGDSPVYRIIADLRRILGDDARAPAYIETIRKRGYRLIASVEHDAVSSSAAAEPSASTAPAVPQALARSRPETSGPRFGLLGLALAVPLVAALAWYAVGGGLRPDGPTPSVNAPNRAPQRIAVLPFTDMSADSSSEHIGDGIAEVLIHQLAQVPEIEVIARNSSFTFKDRSTDVREIGRALDADAVLEGSVQRSNGQLRIAAQLVDSRSGLHYWSKLFDREETNIFAIQDEIALAVIAEIDNASEPGSLRQSTPGEVGFNTYDLYLLGRARLAEQQFEQARALFARAADQAPSFALAHAGLAETYLLQARPSFLGQEAPSEPIEMARRALDRALVLDPGLTEARAAHILLADIERDWAAADEWFETTVAATPGYARAYLYYANASISRALETAEPENIARAQSVLKQARSLDPLNAGVGLRLAQILMISGGYEDARVVARDVYDRARTPADATSALETLGEIAERTGRLDEGIALLRIAHLHAGDPQAQARIAENLGSYHSTIGQTEHGRTWLARGLEEPNISGYIHRGINHLISANVSAMSSMDAVLRSPEPPPGLSETDAHYARLILLHLAGDCDTLIEVAESTATTGVRSAQPLDNLHLASCYLEREDTLRAAPHIATAKEYLDRRMNRLNIAGSGERYLTASLWSVQRNRAETLRWLESAFANGGRHAEVLARDPMFLWLHADPDFEDLIARIRTAEARMRENVAAAERDNDWFALAGVEPKPWMIN